MYEVDTTWFKEAKFGIMVHFGLYSVLEGEYKGKETGEWARERMRIPYDEYHRLLTAFNPLYFDADEWIRTVKDAGAKYFVCTAKHHEGFCLFKTAVSPFNVVDATPFGRDIIGELSDACQKHGIRFGVYYAQDVDWEEPDAGGFLADRTPPEDGTLHNTWDFEQPEDVSKIDFQGYIERKAKPQIKELLTQYHIDYFWFDDPFTVNKQQSREFYQWVKKWAPDCLVNHRNGNGEFDVYGSGDNGVRLEEVQGRANEVPMTMALDNRWSYCVYSNQHFQTPEQIFARKTDLNSRGINLLLNVGPDHLGRFPGPCVRTLHTVGEMIRAQES